MGCLVVGASVNAQTTQEMYVNKMNQNAENLDVRVDEIVLTTSDYNNKDVRITRVDDSCVQIVDKANGKVLETITERTVSKNKDMRNARAKRASGYLVNRLITREKNEGPVTVMIEISITVYVTGSFRQINNIDDAQIMIVSSCSATLENARTNATEPDSYPCTSFPYYGGGVITITAETTLALEASTEFGIDELAKMGFSISGSSNTTTYARKYTSMTGTYSLY